MTGQQEMFPQTNGYSGKQAAEIVGISYRQLDYWARTDLLRPSLADAQGSGSRRRYSWSDLLELKVIKELLDEGLSLKKVREVFSFLQGRLGQDVGSASLVIRGSQSVLVQDGDELIDILQQGQGVLNVLPMAGVVDELDATITELYPGQAEGPSLFEGGDADTGATEADTGS